MAGPKDRDGDAKVRFLSSALNGTTWRLPALQRLSAEPSYQRLIGTLYTSIGELETFEKHQTAEAADSHEGFRKSFWKREAKNTLSPETETFLAELINTFFVGQRQWGKDPRNIHRSRKEAQMQRSRIQREIRKQGPRFNCEMYVCSQRSWKKPRDANRIRCNMNCWNNSPDLR